VALLISLWLSRLDGWYTRTTDWFQLPTPKPEA
jgi:hypothetical protein